MPPLQASKVIREGITAGVVGATSVAIWFLIIDSIARRPFFTPGILGEALVSVFDRTRSAAPESVATNIFIYTLFHYGAFIGAGLIVSVVVHLAQNTPSILGGFFILFIAFEIGFHGLVAVLQETTILGALAWYQIMLGNVIAAALMGAYLWRVHPELGEEVRHALDGVGE